MKSYPFVLIVLLTLTLFPASGKGKGGTDSLTIMTYNVRNCKGLDEITDSRRVASVISQVNADFVALQELDSATVRSKQKVVLNEIASQTQMIPHYSASIPFQGGKYGIGILTREKSLKTESVGLPGREEKRSLLVVEMEKYVLCCTHFSLNAGDRLSSVAKIDSLTQNYKKPVFLAGDFNAVVPSPEMEALCKNWTILNNLEQATFPANKATECIDFILVRKKDIEKVRVTAKVVGNETVASDHLPVWIKLTIDDD
jgi:endonuclease/exonuclease/phosphatase family metal-dependent hydrolase